MALVEESTPEPTPSRKPKIRGVVPLPAPAETRIIAVANQKGGVGKTTSAVNIAAALAQAGLMVMVIDDDKQGNASTALGIEHESGTPSVYDVLINGAKLSEVIQPCPDIENLLCVPATPDLAGAEIELVPLPAREMRLKLALDAYLAERSSQGLPRLDYIFIDCPPSLGLLTVNAFAAAQEVLIAIQCEYYALEGLSQLLESVELMNEYVNPNLRVTMILLTMLDKRTNLSSQVAQEIRTHFSSETLKTEIPRNVRISEAPSYQQTIMTYDPGSKGAKAYRNVARQVTEMAPTQGKPTS